MDTRKSASCFASEKNGSPTANRCYKDNNTNNNTNDMEDIELAESKDEPESVGKQPKRIRAMAKSIVLKLIILILCFCLVCFAGCFLVKTRCVSVESFRNECKAKGGFFEHVEVSDHFESFLGDHKWVCHGVGGAR